MNDNLIQELSQGLEKSRKPWLPGRFLSLMLLLSLVSGSVFLGLWGPRFDLAGAVASFAYRTEVFLLLSLAFIAYLMAAASCIPGRARGPGAVLAGLLIIMATLFGMFVMHPEAYGPSHMNEGWHCLALILANALLPALITIALVRRHAAPTRPTLTLSFILLGSLGAAVTVQHMICPFNETWHLVIWHLAVLPGALLLARAAGAKVLRW